MNHPLLAQIYNPVLPSALGGQGSTATGGTITGNIVSSIAGLLFIVAFLFAFVYLLTGGIQWISSNGEKAALESARNKITHAIIGLIIVAAAWAIFSLVGDFIGIKLPTIKIPTIGGTTTQTGSAPQNSTTDTNGPRRSDSLPAPLPY